MVEHTYNLSIQEVEQGGQEFKADWAQWPRSVIPDIQEIRRTEV
jgi:hypothetical protein